MKKLLFGSNSLDSCPVLLYLTKDKLQVLELVQYASAWGKPDNII